MTDEGRLARIALFTLAGAALLVTVIILFGAHLWAPRDRYYIDVEGTVYGLERGGDVYYEGVPIGNVGSIDIDHVQLGRVRVGISIDRDTPVRANTRAYFLYAGVTGVKEIDLRDGSGDSSAVPPGSTIAVGASELDIVEQKLASLADTATHTFANADRVTANLAALTDRDQLGSVLATAGSAVDDLAATARDLRSTLAENRAHLTSAMASLDHAATRAEQVMTGPVDGIARRADAVLGRLDDVVRINAGELHTAIVQLGQAGRAFGELGHQLQQSPSQLLFSRPSTRRRLP
jgi:phospholipid/cholesterol/gamma-HCH transport system substrate-binding protein